MAALAADIAYVFDPRWEIGSVQRPATGADTYYRGGIAHSIAATGLLTLAPAATAFYAGIVSEHKVVAAANELVWIASAGRWFITCSALTLARTDLAFAMAAADLFDNPASLVVSVAGTAGAMGVLSLCTTDAQDGWINTDFRVVTENL
jgi:hypothetical protein